MPEGVLEATAQKARPWEPDASADVRMHPLTLRFAPPLEKTFESDYFDRTMGHVRLALLLAFALYSVFGVLDAWIAPAQRKALWFIRYAVFGPIVLGSLWFTYAPTYKRYRERALTVVVLVGGLGIVVMTSIIPAPGSYLYYAGLLLTVMFIFTLFRLTLPYSTATTLVVIAAYLVVALWLNPTPAALVINNLFFLVSAEIIGFGSGYSMERYARTNFLQGRVIEARTQEVEDRSRELHERNEELTLKNQMLAESRAETLKTVRRTELMFAALSEALPGTVLDDKYRVGDKIGSGSFGTVYRGEHISLHHPVAIKVFRPAVGTDALESLDRFRREGISACRINHPNAVTVLDFDVSAGSLAYLVMELLEGHSLAEELDRSKMRPDRSMRIAAAVCDALSEAHAAGIVHRDIKPTNVFLHHVRGVEQVKVIDFGIAKLTNQNQAGGDTATLTMAGFILGSPAYMAPERLVGDPYDGRADVYAVGVMLYEMLCGRLPFESAVLGYWSNLAHLERQPAPPSTIRPDVPAVLDSLVFNAMAKEADRRPTAAELALALRSLSGPQP